MRHIIELTLFYLEQEPPRLEDADKFFVRFMDSKVKPYAGIGKVGHAIVLAFQDKAEESTALFLDVLGEPRNEKLEQSRFVLDSPQLRRWIARALDHNAANLEAVKKPLPDSLKPLRSPPFSPAKNRRP